MKIPWDPEVMNLTPICLPFSEDTKNETFNGINCMATGWGQMQMKGPLQDSLRQVELKVVDNQHCSVRFFFSFEINFEDILVVILVFRKCMK